MNNWLLTIQYDGTDFHGWQEQEGLRTIQGELRRALSLLEGREVTLHGAGRTDAGVHAEGQAASVMLTREFEADALRSAVNGNTSRDVRVINAVPVNADFHARYSAKSKTYCYRIFNERVMSPFWMRYALHEARPLDVRAMREAAAVLIGEHDWTTFSAAQAEARTRVRTVTRLDVDERRSSCGRGRLIEIRISAEGFLRYMVRSITGALLEAGRSESNVGAIRRALEARDRRLSPATAPAHGLTLVEVEY